MNGEVDITAVTASTKIQRCMDKVKQNWHTWLNTSVQLVTIGALVFWGGGLWQMVGSHETRINNLEGRGSPGLRVHEAMDDERFSALKADVRAQSTIISTVGDMRGDLKVIQTKLDKLSEDLKDHVERGKTP